MVRHVVKTHLTTSIRLTFNDVTTPRIYEAMIYHVVLWTLHYQLIISIYVTIISYYYTVHIINIIVWHRDILDCQRGKDKYLRARL